MTACPYCHDSLGHIGLTECPESGRPLPAARPDQVLDPDPTAPNPTTDLPSCPHCDAIGGHLSLEYCPDTGKRMPAAPSATEPANQSTAMGRLAPANDAGATAASPRDPYAAYEKPWLLEIPGRDPIGLDDDDSVVLGRDPTSPIGGWCADNISRRHVELSTNNHELYATDLGSTNGTFLNGQRLEKGRAVPCHDGDVLQLASEEPIRLTVRR